MFKLIRAGLQGAMLSSLIHPIYLETITIGSMFNASALSRALVERLRTLQGINNSSNHVI